MKTAETKVTSALQHDKNSGLFLKKNNSSEFFTRYNTPIATKSFFPPTVQPKLKIGQPNDKYEKEADRVAETVVRKIQRSPAGNSPKDADYKDQHTINPFIQRACTECDKEKNLQKQEEEPRTQRKPAFESNSETPDEQEIHRKANSETFNTSNNIENRLNSTKGQGQPLDKNTRQQMETGIGADFGNVRIHTDSEAALMNQELNAKAFTHGADIYFNNGNYNTNSSEGKQLLAHELTHTKQQDSHSKKIERDNLLLEPLSSNTKKVGEENYIPKLLNQDSVFWMIDHNNPNIDFILHLRESLNLRDIAHYYSGNIQNAGLIAEQNKIPVDKQLYPGDRIYINRQKISKPKHSALNDFLNSPKIPVEISNPQEYLSNMGVPIPSYYNARQAILEKSHEADFVFIINKLNEIHYSDSDENMVIEILKKWANEPFLAELNLYQKYKNGGYYLDKMFNKLRMKTTSEGIVADWAISYYHKMLKHFDRKDDILRLMKQINSSWKEDIEPPAQGNFFKDVVLKTVIALPGGLTAGVGGLVSSLPFDWAQKAGGWLEGKAVDYLKAVGYGDKNMIEQAVKWSSVSGAVLGDTIMLVYGGWIIKAKGIIDAISKTQVILTLKEKIDSLKERIPVIVNWFENPEKIIDVLLGIEGQEVITPIENWANTEEKETEKEDEETPWGKITEKKALQKIIRRITEAIKFIKKILRPIFKIRNAFLTIIDKIISLQPLMDIFDFFEKVFVEGSKNIKEELGLLSDKFIIALNEKFSEIKEIVMNKIESATESIESFMINPKEIGEALTNFAMKILGKKLSVIQILSNVQPVKDLINTNLIVPLLPTELLQSVNTQMQTFQSKVIPIINFAKGELNSLFSSASEIVNEHVVPSIKELFVQPSLKKSKEEKNRINKFGFEDNIKHSKGTKISENTRTPLEETFESNFNDVIIHQDLAAQQASESIQADAFTIGNDIYFNKGKYDPESDIGNSLIAHELTHVVQQRNGIVNNTIQSKGKTPEQYAKHFSKKAKAKRTRTKEKKDKKETPDSLKKEIKKLLYPYFIKFKNLDEEKTVEVTTNKKQTTKDQRKKIKGLATECSTCHKPPTEGQTWVVDHIPPTALVKAGLMEGPIRLYPQSSEMAAKQGNFVMRILEYYKKGDIDNAKLKMKEKPLNKLLTKGHGKGIPASDPDGYTPEEKEIIQKIGNETGCHHSKNETAAKTFIADHVPPNKLVDLIKKYFEKEIIQRLRPQCKKCSDKQGTEVTIVAKKVKELEKRLDTTK